MTDLPDLFGGATDFILKIAESHLAPEYQAGDFVTATKASTADPGRVVVAVVDGQASVRRWPVEGSELLGVVTGMFRRVS